MIRHTRLLFVAVSWGVLLGLGVSGPYAFLAAIQVGILVCIADVLDHYTARIKR